MPPRLPFVRVLTDAVVVLLQVHSDSDRIICICLNLVLLQAVLLIFVRAINLGFSLKPLKSGTARIYKRSYRV